MTTDKNVDMDPSTWKRITFQIGGFYVPKSGEKILGKVVAYRQNKKNQNNYYLIQLIKPCKALSVDEDERTEGKMLDLKSGEILWLNETAGLRELRYYVGNEVPMYVFPEEKKDIGGGKTFWAYDVRVPPGTRKGQAANPLDTEIDPTPSAKSGETIADGDEIPF